LSEAESFIISELTEHHLVNDFVQNFDLENVIEKIFSTNGHIMLYEMIDDFSVWETKLSGELYTFGCSSMSTSNFATENRSKIESIKKSIQTGVEYRLREEIENHTTIANELENELESSKNCEKVAILAKNIKSINDRRIASDLYIKPEF